MSDELDPLEVAAVRRVLWSLADDDADPETLRDVAGDFEELADWFEATDEVL